MFEKIAFWAGLILPLFDIPLIVNIIKRRSSADISMVWAIGLWVTSVLLLIGTRAPVALGFNIANVVMLTVVMVVVIKYRKGQA